MDDLISRQAAQDAIQKRMSMFRNADCEWAMNAYNGACECLGEIKKLPTAQQEQRWIPVSERLPEKDGRYLVTNTQWGAYEVDWDIFYKEQDDWLFGKDVTAWMPLPEPYKEERG